MKLTASKDSATWNISGATVTLYLEKPDGTTVTKAGSIDTSASGTAHVDLTTTDLDTAGSWRRSWKVSVSGVTLESSPINFSVDPNLG